MPTKAKLTTRERTTSNVSSDNFNKGSELSFAEADSNFINLRDQSIAISDGSTSTDIEAGETITFSGASVSGNTVTVPTGAGITVVGDDSSGTLINGGETLKIAGGSNVTTAMSGDTLTITSSGGGGSGLGSHLEVKDNTTIHAINTNDDLTLEANGTGKIIAEGNFRCTGSVEITNSIDAVDNVTVTGTVTANDFKTGQIDIDDNIIQTNLSNANLELKANGTGKVQISGLSYPTSDGSNGQVLQTDGAGNLSFVNQSGGGGSTGDLTIDTYSNSDFGVDTVRLQVPNGEDLELNAGTGGGPGGSGDRLIHFRDRVQFHNDINSDGSNGNIKLTPNGTGKVQFHIGAISGYTFPRADATSGGKYLVLSAHDGSNIKNLGFTDVLEGSNLTATGTHVKFTNLPTSDPGEAGRVWNDSGTLKISAG